MLKLLALILLSLVPISDVISGLINKDNASKNEAPLFANEQNFKLPLQADIFVVTQYQPAFPQRKWDIKTPEIPAKVALAYDTYHKQILFQKNGIEDQYPIASITKLMTALVVIENENPDTVYKVSKRAVETSGEMGNLVVGEKLSVESLLYALLVESSNDAAMALAENIGASHAKPESIASSTASNFTQMFVELMNKKARKMDLQNTFFADPTGLDPQNLSSAWDIKTILQEAIKYPLIQEIMQTQNTDIYSSDGQFNHYLSSTNKLLGLIPEIIGGKTGYTEEAGNSMTLAVKSPDSKGAIIIVVLGAQDRMAEIKKIYEWTKDAYIW